MIGNADPFDDPAEYLVRQPRDRVLFVDHRRDRLQVGDHDNGAGGITADTDHDVRPDRVQDPLSIKKREEQLSDPLHLPCKGFADNALRPQIPDRISLTGDYLCLNTMLSADEDNLGIIISFFELLSYRQPGKEMSASATSGNNHLHAFTPLPPYIFLRAIRLTFAALFSVSWDSSSPREILSSNPTAAMFTRSAEPP